MSEVEKKLKELTTEKPEELNSIHQGGRAIGENIPLDILIFLFAPIIVAFILPIALMYGLGGILAEVTD